MSKFVKPSSIILFGGLIVIAFLSNYDIFLQYIDKVIFLVFLHNLVAITTGLLASRIAQLSDADQKTIAIETGIQNSGLGLLLIFSFFNGLGGMAIVAAWWGIWHIIAGIFVALLFSNIQLSTVKN
jgi:BASS family bile acid:Na+ symporter